MNKNLVILAIVLIVLLAGGLLAYNAYQSNKITQPTLSNTQQNDMPQMTDDSSPTDTPTITTQETPPSTGSSAITQNKNTVTITSQGFNPQTITVKKGETITWTNSDTVDHTVNSDNHPTHLLYPFLNQVSLIKPSQSKSLKLDNTGTFTYHDHLNATLTGKIIVK